MGSVPEGLTRVRLTAVVECSFQRSEATNLAIFQKASYYPGDLKRGEAFLLVSRMGNQVVFVLRNPAEVEVGKVIRKVLDTRRLRLSGGTWSPYMLQNYAHEAGLHLVGIKRFEQVHDDRQERKRAHRGS